MTIGIRNLSRAGHLLGAHQAVELVRRDEAEPQRLLLQRGAVGMCDQIVNAVPQINAGTIKAYAIATPERNPSLPNVPTTAEAGLPNFQAQAWNAMFAPKGTSPAIIASLNAAAIKALDDETVKKRLLELGSVIPAPKDRTPEALATLVKNEIAKWSPVLKPAT